MPLRPASLAAALCLALAAPAAAEAPRAAAEGRARVQLLPGWRQPDGSRLAALAIELAPGWHTYWRNPGAAGIPPEFDWSGSKNLASIRYEWPRPIVFSTYGLRTFGYRDELVLPLVLVPETPDAPIELELELFFGVCHDICIPAEVRISAELPTDAPESGRARIEAALSQRPHTPAEAGIAAARCEIRPGKGGMEVTARIRFRDAPPAAPVAVIEAANPDLRFDAPVSRLQGDTLTAKAELDWHGPGAPIIDRSTLRLTLLDPRHAVEIRGCPAP
jgi:DsbC/DsbD-like thiol-disulfide interchange protein